MAISETRTKPSKDKPKNEVTHRGKYHEIRPMPNTYCLPTRSSNKPSRPLHKTFPTIVSNVSIRFVKCSLDGHNVCLTDQRKRIEESVGITRFCSHYSNYKGKRSSFTGFWHFKHAVHHLYHTAATRTLGHLSL